jgi:hypothetical protein
LPAVKRQPVRKLTPAAPAALSHPPAESRDPHGDYTRRIVELAKRVGKYPAFLAEEWDERAAVREYCGGVSRREANEAAWADLLDRYEPQPRLLEDP